ncbi:MAG: hypothetical protein K9N23_10160 [Akkermansiaceae bacterium]|nr:hypothetical protein [Akkermansiaceae bacterium]MCF7732043.1 hypothetical protein [Akkermansiaceae bacterium]
MSGEHRASVAAAALLFKANPPQPKLHLPSRLTVAAVSNRHAQPWRAHA